MKLPRSRKQTLLLTTLLLCGLCACNGELAPPSSADEDYESGPPTPEDVFLQGPVVFTDWNFSGTCDAGDRLRFTFSDSVTVVHDGEELAVEDVFRLTSLRPDGQEGSETFGAGASFFLGDSYEDVVSDSLTIILGQEPYIKARQKFATGDDAFYPTGLRLAQSPSQYLREHRILGPREDSVRINGGPLDVVPGILPGQALLEELEVRAVAMADLDGDGDQDLVCGLEEGTLEGEVTFLLNNGQFPATFFEAEQVLSVGLGEGFQRYVDELECADFDGDGDIDLLTLSRLPVAQPLWLNQGDGTFVPAAATSLIGRRADGCSFGDLDSDGDLDLVIASDDEDTILIFENDGPNLFELAPVVLEAHGVRDVACCDFDRDGRMDLISGGYLAGQNRICWNDGLPATLGFGRSFSEIYMSSSVDRIFLVDWDSNGAMDFCTSSDENGTAPWLLRNDGQGGVESPRVLAGYGDQMAFEDFDGDGRMDVAHAQCSFFETRVEYASEGAFHSFSSPSPVGVAYAARAMCSGDLDGDGDLDLVLAGCGAGVQLVGSSLAGVRGRLTLRGEEHLPFGYFRSTHLVDMDADGDLDLVGISEDHILLNDGSGSFSPLPLPILPQNTLDLDVGDLDGDGDPDLVIARNTAQPFGIGLSFYWNDGGTFSSDERDLIGAGMTGVELADVNNDGSLDLYCSKVAEGTDFIYLNDGGGNFTLLGAVSSGEPVLAVRFHDMDRDGDLDLLRCVLNGGISVRLNDGAGTFGGGYQTLLDCSSMCVLDADRDGDPDIVAQDGDQLRVLYNQGDGAYYISGEQFGDSWTNAIEAVDIDGDGDQDLVVAGNDELQPIWLNDGAGVFTQSTHQVPGMCAELVHGDVDMDGDPDVLLSTLYLGGVYQVRSE